MGVWQLRAEPAALHPPRVWNPESRKALAPSSKPLKLMIVIKIFVFNTRGCVCVCVSSIMCEHVCLRVSTGVWRKQVWGVGSVVMRERAVPAHFGAAHRVDLNLLPEILGPCRGPSRDAEGAGEREWPGLLLFPTANL